MCNIAFKKPRNKWIEKYQVHVIKYLYE
jgi:hypothetical protein